MTKFGDLDSLHDLTTNELRFDKQEIANLRLNRNEMRYYESLQYAMPVRICKNLSIFEMRG